MWYPSPQRRLGSRACPWLEQGAAAEAIGPLDSRFRVCEENLLPPILSSPWRKAGIHRSAWEAFRRGHDRQNYAATTETCTTMDPGFAPG